MPKAADLNVDGAVEGVGGPAAGPVEELVAREHPLRPCDEAVKQVVLGAGQRDLGGRITRGHRAGRQIDNEIGDAHAFGRGLGGWHAGAVGPSQDGADPGQQDPRVERLRNVIVGPHLQAEDPVDVLGLRGEHDDGWPTGLAQAAADGQAVLARQHPVEDDEVRLRP